jgi:transcriptional regulator with XRE-family HTH domain
MLSLFMSKRLKGTPSLFQQRIRERREELKDSEGLTQTKIASAIGIASPEFITMLEKGRRNLDLNKVPMLADVLKIDRKDLCKLALYEAAPSLYAELFDTLSPPGVRKEVLTENGEVIPSSTMVLTGEMVYAVQRLVRLPDELRRSVERLIEALDEYVSPPYRGRHQQ